MKKYKVLSLDIWDTILRRKCHPDEIKVATSRFIYLKYFNDIKEENRDINLLTQKRIEAEREIGQKIQGQYDDEYELNEVLFTFLKKIIKIDKIYKVQEIVEQAYRYELTTEKDNIYLDSGIVDKIDSIQYEKLGYISDFYAGTTFLDELLKHVGFDKHIDFKYSSCEKRFNKRSGRLFDLVHEELGILPQDHIHIGDNKHSDFDVPKAKGIQAIHYLDDIETTKKIKLDKQFYSRVEEPQVYFRDFYIQDKNISSNIAYQDGRDKTLLLYGFVSWIIEDCLKKGIDKVFYFTREGEFFKKIHDEILKVNPYGIPLPKAEVLEVSRIATFVGSLRSITLDEMMRIWNQYSIQKMSAFFKSLTITIQQVQPFLDKYELEWNEEITYPWLDVRVQKLFEDEKFVMFMQKIVDEHRDRLRSYFATRGFEIGQEDVAIVDIGWRGTIQDNICYIYPEKQVYGYYMGLVPVLNEQPVNAYKYGYIDEYYHAEKLLRFITPLEMICNSPNGSTIGYECIEGKMQAIRNTEKRENVIYEQYTQYFQRGVLESIEAVGGIVGTHGLTYESYKQYSYNQLKELLVNPSRKLAESYFHLKHNEEFGVGIFIDKRTVFRGDLFIKGLFGKKYRVELIEYLNTTSWPQGYLIKYRLSILNKMYNDRLLRGY